MFKIYMYMIYLKLPCERGARKKCNFLCQNIENVLLTEVPKLMADASPLYDLLPLYDLNIIKDPC